MQQTFIQSCNVKHDMLAHLDPRRVELKNAIDELRKSEILEVRNKREEEFKKNNPNSDKKFEFENDVQISLYMNNPNIKKLITSYFADHPYKTFSTEEKDDKKIKIPILHNIKKFEDKTKTSKEDKNKVAKVQFEGNNQVNNWLRSTNIRFEVHAIKYVDILVNNILRDVMMRSIEFMIMNPNIKKISIESFKEFDEKSIYAELFRLIPEYRNMMLYFKNLEHYEQRKNDAQRIHDLEYEKKKLENQSNVAIAKTQFVFENAPIFNAVFGQENYKNTKGFDTSFNNMWKFLKTNKNTLRGFTVGEPSKEMCERLVCISIHKLFVRAIGFFINRIIYMIVSSSYNILNKNKRTISKDIVVTSLKNLFFNNPSTFNEIDEKINVMYNYSKETDETKKIKNKESGKMEEVKILEDYTKFKEPVDQIEKPKAEKKEENKEEKKEKTKKKKETKETKETTEEKEGTEKEVTEKEVTEKEVTKKKEERQKTEKKKDEVKKTTKENNTQEEKPKEEKPKEKKIKDNKPKDDKPKDDKPKEKKSKEEKSKEDNKPKENGSKKHMNGNSEVKATN